MNNAHGKETSHHPFTKRGFHDVVGADLWLLEKATAVPGDPPPVFGQQGRTAFIRIVETFHMPAVQDAVVEYQNRLVPALFLVAQKVYAEIFRFVLESQGIPTDWQQEDIEKHLSKVSAGSNVAPFLSYHEFESWRSKKYDFKKLRKARNTITHDKYEFDGTTLAAPLWSGSTLSWSTVDVLTFAKEVLEVAKRVC